MFVAYDGIVFDMLYLDGWQVDADLSNDGVDFLRWHHTIDITCVLNESATAAYKFPKFTSQNASDINRQRAQEAFSRLNSKQRNQISSTMKSGQIYAENIKKILSNALGPAAPLFGLPQTTQLPSGQVVTPPTDKGYPPWEQVTPSLKFSKSVSSQQGQGLTPPSGGPSSNDPANVAPGNTTSSSTVEDFIAGFGAGIIGGGGAASVAAFGADIVKAGLGFGTSVVERVTKAALAAASSWWSETLNQLIGIGNDLGITANDIFGAGRQPLENVNFPVPPIKRALNPPPPEASSNTSAGWTPPITFQELEERLNRPRRVLAAWINSGPNGSPEFFLYSPYLGLSVDALKGPICRIMHLPAMHGNVTGILKLRFETWVAPPPQFLTATQRVQIGGESINKLRTPGFSNASNSALRTPNITQQAPSSIGVGLLGGAAATVVGQGGLFPPQGQPFSAIGTFVNNPIVLATPPLISNRWTMKQSPDPATYLNTTIIQGTAHFRMDVLQALQLTPDQLRLYFMHPIPFGYVRMPPEVTILSDGASVEYTIVDIQQMLNNPGGQRWGVHSVKARQQMHYHSPIDYVRAPFALKGDMGVAIGAVMGGWFNPGGGSKK